MAIVQLEDANNTFCQTAATATGSEAVAELGVFVLPPALDDEAVADDDTRVNSEGYTSRIYMCCY